MTFLTLLLTDFCHQSYDLRPSLTSLSWALNYPLLSHQNAIQCTKYCITIRYSARMSCICSSDSRRCSGSRLSPYRSTVLYGSEATLGLVRSRSCPRCATSFWISAACRPAHGTDSVQQHHYKSE